jgi:hypothetical protein
MAMRTIIPPLPIINIACGFLEMPRPSGLAIDELTFIAAPVSAVQSTLPMPCHAHPLPSVISTLYQRARPLLQGETLRLASWGDITSCAIGPVNLACRCWSVQHHGRLCDVGPGQLLQISDSHLFIRVASIAHIFTFQRTANDPIGQQIHEDIKGSASENS